MQKVPDYIKKQLSTPGLPVPEPKPKFISEQAMSKQVVQWPAF